MVVLRIAGRDGPAFRLDPSGRNLLGRTDDSLVALADRLASRSHAAILFDAATADWRLEDLGSRNGTWLDGVRVASARLTEGSVIRVGTTDLVFRLPEPAAAAAEPEVVRSGTPGELEGEALRRSIAAGEGRFTMLLYQAVLRLLTAGRRDDVVAVTLELAAEFTTAANFGWFDLDRERRLETVCVVPPGSGLPAIVARSVEREAAAGRAVWVTTADAGGLACIPLLSGQRPFAMLAASSPGGLRETDFDILLTLANLAAAAAAGRTDAGPPASGATTDSLAFAEGLPGDDEFESDGGTISLSPDAVRSWLAEGRGPPPAIPADASCLRIDDWQRALALEALRRCGGNVPAAATLLGISRATLYRRLEAWGLTRDGGPAAPA